MIGTPFLVRTTLNAHIPRVMESISKGGTFTYADYADHHLLCASSPPNITWKASGLLSSQSFVLWELEELVTDRECSFCIPIRVIHNLRVGQNCNQRRRHSCFLQRDYAVCRFETLIKATVVNGMRLSVINKEAQKLYLLAAETRRIANVILSCMNHSQVLSWQWLSLWAFLFLWHRVGSWKEK